MKQKILLVDDRSAFHLIHTAVLSMTGEGCEIATASNAQEALDLINRYLVGKESVPDMIFIHLNMAANDGLEFIRVFQSLRFPNKEKVTLVILTAPLDSKNQIGVRQLGLKYYISGPLSLKDVHEILHDQYGK